MNVLHLHLRAEYFDAIKNGEKKEEYRLVNPFWMKRLSRPYDAIALYRGYPKAGDADAVLWRTWKEPHTKVITHPLFGEKPVRVYAIDVTEPKS